MRMTSSRTKRLLAAILLTGFAGAALASSPFGDAPNAGAPNADDAAFMQHAAADGLAEVQMGQMALDKSSDASLKALAQRIVDDHEKANQQLKTLAASKQVTLPDAPDADALKESRKLDALKGGAFDKAWSKDMVDAHKKAVKLFTTESKKAADADVRQFAQTTLPVLQNHLQMATQVASVPDARDKAMDAAMKSMSTSSDEATAVPVAAAPAPAAAAVKTAPPPAKSH
jgi:putative membrane protein